MAGEEKVKVQLRGLHKVSRRLSGGGMATYFYAWRSGPRIEAAPDTPEFLAEFQRLTAERDQPRHHSGLLQELITGYQRSAAFTDLAAKTRHDYARIIRKIEAEFGDLPIRALVQPATRGVFLDWRDAMTGRREGDYCLSVLARVLSWAMDRGRIPVNLLKRPGRRYSGSRLASTWSADEIAAFLARAPAQVRLPFLIALHTGQREGDILRLTWGAWDGAALVLRQSKRGRHVRIPATTDLQAALKAAPRVAVTICATSRRTAWTESGFRASFAKARAAAGVVGRTFHDLRGTAITRLGIAGCTVPEIATITGHSLEDVEAILDAHYLGRDQAMGDAAISKLERHGQRTAVVNGAVNASVEGPENTG